jgi:hypothetical protein
MIVASLWVHRPIEHPGAADYPGMLRILEGSCNRLGLAHVVLTDRATLEGPLWPAGIRAFVVDNCPRPLMQACTEAQARFLECWSGDDVAFVGADCIMLKKPNLPAGADLYVTYRHKAANYPINTGLQFIPKASLDRTAPVFRRIADRCGVKWCDDQRALRAELEPMPDGPGIYDRAGIRVGFVPMRPYNVLPKGVNDPARDAVMLHFRGKQHSTGQHRKEMLFDWAKRHGFA